MKASSFALAFDCACSALSVAVLENENVLAQHFETTAMGQAATLAPAIKATLAQARVKPADLDLIAVTNGPGSFTGIRIGLAMARGLALALKLPLASCSTFEAVSANLQEQQRSVFRPLLAIDSRREEIFLALDTPDRPFIGRPQEAVQRLPPDRYGLIGDGAEFMREAFAALGREREIALLDARPPVAANFAPLLVVQGIAYWRARNEREGMPRPLYLREADVTLPKTAPTP